MKRPRASIDVERWCEATGVLLDIEVVVSGCPMRPDRSVGGHGGVEDIDVERLEIDGHRLPLVTPSGWWFDLTPAEENRAEDALIEVVADAAIAAWENRHG